MSILLATFWRIAFPLEAFAAMASLQRKKCCQQIIGLNDEPFSVAVCIDAKKESVLGKMLGRDELLLGVPYYGVATSKTPLPSLSVAKKSTCPRSLIIPPVKAGYGKKGANPR
jgi:hypothetical protein